MGGGRLRPTSGKIAILTPKSNETGLKKLTFLLFFTVILVILEEAGTNRPPLPYGLGCILEGTVGRVKKLIDIKVRPVIKNNFTV